MVCRDERGRVLTLVVARIYDPSPLVAEAVSLREAFLVGKNLHLQKVIFESDNLTLIEACRGEKVIREI